jgi:hypothetical protein
MGNGVDMTNDYKDLLFRLRSYIGATHIVRDTHAAALVIEQLVARIAELEARPVAWIWCDSIYEDHCHSTDEEAIEEGWRPMVYSDLEGCAAPWQQIETAPKDCEIWAFNGDQARMKWSEGAGWALWIWADDLLSEVDPEPDQPTHWMSLPVAPIAAQAASQGGGDV